MKLADSHIHLFAKGFPGRYGTLFPTGRELITYEAIRETHQIDHALVIGYEGDPWAKGNNAYLAKLAAARPWMAPLAFCATDRLDPRRLTNWWTQGFFGISLYVFDAQAVQALLAAPDEWVGSLNERRAIISLNCSPATAAKLRPLWERLRETRILFSHLGLPGTMASATRKLPPLLRLADLPQVSIKLSGVYACNAFPHPGLTEIVDTLFETFGTSRLHWGSDFCPALDHISFEQTISAIADLCGGPRRRAMAANLTEAIRRVRL